MEAVGIRSGFGEGGDRDANERRGGAGKTSAIGSQDCGICVDRAQSRGACELGDKSAETNRRAELQMLNFPYRTLMKIQMVSCGFDGAARVRVQTVPRQAATGWPAPGCWWWLW